MPRNIKHSDETLKTGSDYLEYIVNMYVHTRLWLRKHDAENKGPSLEKNAVLESHLVHARILIEFLSKEESSWPDDVLAVDFFHDSPDSYNVLDDEVLDDWVAKIGKRLVHITTEPMPTLKSEQGWKLDEMAGRLIPALRRFVEAVPESRLYDEGPKEKFREHLDKVVLPSK